MRPTITEWLLIAVTLGICFAIAALAYCLRVSGNGRREVRIAIYKTCYWFSLSMIGMSLGLALGSETRGMCLINCGAMALNVLSFLMWRDNLARELKGVSE